MLRALILAVGLTAPITSQPSAPAPRAGSAPEEVRLRTDDDLELVGTFLPPKKKGLAPGALLIHDAGGDRGQLLGLAQRLQKSGFGVLTLDLRGHGGSRSPDRSWRDLSPEEQSSLWARATRDVEAGASWLLSQDSIHSTNLSLIGLGSGCALAVRHAKRDENVRAVALLAPRSRDFGFDVAADLLKIEGLPTLVFAPRDEYQADTERMVQEANATNGAEPYVELSLAGPKVTSILEDKKMPSKVSSWVQGVAQPKRGRG